VREERREKAEKDVDTGKTETAETTGEDENFLNQSCYFRSFRFSRINVFFCFFSAFFAHSAISALKKERITRK